MGEEKMLEKGTYKAESGIYIYIYLWVDSFSVSSFRVFVVQNLILSEARRVGLHDSPLPSSVSLAPFMGNY